uniref:lactonase family protein n=1 Tax=Clostridium sp. NkU-1 TaxID=1095009 RepID=UPI003261982A
MAERNFRPHVSCTRRTPDGKFIMVADLGIDQVKIYRFNEKDEEMILVDALHCELESAPKCFRFSSDGRFFYLISELKNVIDVFTYETGERQPKIEKIQTVSTTGPKHSQLTAACSMRMSNDEKYLFCGNAGDNSVSVYKRDKDTGF